MFNARRGGLRVAVLYWLIEKTRRRTLELTAGLGTRRFDAFRLFCPAALLSSPAQVGHPSKLSRFAVKRVIFVQFPVTRVPARRGAPICRASPHTLTFPTADADFSLGSSSLLNHLVTHSRFCSISRKPVRATVFCSPRRKRRVHVWRRDQPLTKRRN